MFTSRRFQPAAVGRALCMLAVGAAMTAGCSGGSEGGAAGSGGGASGAGGSGAGSTAAAPCGLETRVGGFSVQLIEPTLGNQAYSTMGGGIRSGVTPSQVWHRKGDAEGGCEMLVGPTFSCTPTCASPQICGGQNQCIAEPTLVDAGEVTLTGVGPSSLTLTDIKNNYTGSLTAPYPPFTPGAAVGLHVTGGVAPALTLDATGFEPLVFEGTGLTLVGGQALSFTWTAPAQATAARIFVKLEIGHHGGTAARVECDLPDTGAGQIPAALVSALIAEGAHGFPTISLTRRTASSIDTSIGCVDFVVAAPAERAIVVCPTAGHCIASCTGDEDCTAPQTCNLADNTCG
jgi:hypothetical protein